MNAPESSGNSQRKEDKRDPDTERKVEIFRILMEGRVKGEDAGYREYDGISIFELRASGVTFSAHPEKFYWMSAKDFAEMVMDGLRNPMSRHRQ